MIDWLMDEGEEAEQSAGDHDHGRMNWQSRRRAALDKR